MLQVPQEMPIVKKVVMPITLRMMVSHEIVPPLESVGLDIYHNIVAEVALINVSIRTPYGPNRERIKVEIMQRLKRVRRKGQEFVRQQLRT